MVSNIYVHFIEEGIEWFQMLLKLPKEQISYKWQRPNFCSRSIYRGNWGSFFVKTIIIAIIFCIEIIQPILSYLVSCSPKYLFLRLSGEGIHS